MQRLNGLESILVCIRSLSNGGLVWRENKRGRGFWKETPGHNAHSPFPVSCRSVLLCPLPDLCKARKGKSRSVSKRDVIVCVGHWTRPKLCGAVMWRFSTK